MGWAGKAWLAAALIGGLGAAGILRQTGAPFEAACSTGPDSAEALERIEADEGASWDRLEEEQGLRELPDLQALAAEIGPDGADAPAAGRGVDGRAGGRSRTAKGTLRLRDAKRP